MSEHVHTDKAAQKNSAARDGRIIGTGFDPKAHMRQLKGQDYLEARWRVVWFREENPDGRIETQIVHHDREKKEIMFRATVTVPATGASATGYCEGCERDFRSGYVEKAETQAVGRALAFLGYGTAQASELDIGEGEKMADAPLAPRQTSAPPVQPVPTVRRVTADRPALDRVADEMATEAGDALPGQGPPPKTASVDGIRRNELFASIQALVGAGVKLDTGERWKELARVHEMVEPARSADMTVGWLEELYRRMRERQSQPQPQTEPQIAQDKREQAKREQALAGWIATAPDEGTLTELRSDVMGAFKLGSLTDKAAEALLEAVAARSAELDLYPEATDGASASDRADAEAEEVTLEATVPG